MPIFTFMYYCFVIWVMFSILTFPRMKLEKKLILCFFTYAFPIFGPLIGYHLLKRHRDREIARILRERQAYHRRSRYAEPPIVVRRQQRTWPAPQRPTRPRRPKPVEHRDPGNIDIEKDTRALDDLLEAPEGEDESPYVFRELKEKHDALREIEHESVEIPTQTKGWFIVLMVLLVAAQFAVAWFWYMNR